MPTGRGRTTRRPSAAGATLAPLPGGRPGPVSARRPSGTGRRLVERWWPAAEVRCTACGWRPVAGGARRVTAPRQGDQRDQRADGDRRHPGRTDGSRAVVAMALSR